MRLQIDEQGTTASLSVLRLRATAVDIAEMKLDWCAVDNDVAVDGSTELRWQLQEWRAVFAATSIIAKARRPGSSCFAYHTECVIYRWRALQEG